MLILKNIKKKYRSAKSYALKNINLILPNTGIVAILGESGSGKSTLLNLIGAIDSPTSGEIWLDDINLNALNEHKKNQIHHEYISFVFQHYNLIEYLTVIDNVMLVCNEETAKKNLKKLGIYALRNKKINTLSGGQMQRVVASRAISSESKILLCDEPTGALDKENGEKLLKLLKTISEHKLVIIVTHNEEQANTHADRIIKLSDGVVISDTDPIKDYSVKRSYKYNKVKIKTSKLLKIIHNNILYKIKRNILTILAFSIGLIALLLVLSIKSGFMASLKESERNTLGTYPLYISKYSQDMDELINDVFKSSEEIKDNKVISYEEEHENNITKDYLHYLSLIEENIQYQEKTYVLNNKYIRTFKENSPFFNEVDLIEGKLPNNLNEVLLLINKSGGITSSILKSIKLNKKEYDYKDIIDYTFKINNRTYKIVGIINGKDESFYEDISGIYCNEDNFKKLIPEEIYLFPKSYKDKLIIKTHLKKYKPDILFTDYASTVKNVSITLMKGLSTILIVFSVISLFVATMMIGILNYISVIERIKEIGILKSLGFSSWNIKKIFYLETIIISSISGILSGVVVFILSFPISHLIYEITSLKNVLVLDKKSFFIVLIIGIILSLIGSFIPINKTKKMTIIDTLRYNE